MTEKQCASYFAEIYMAGPLPVAEQLCRKYCTEAGLCVNIWESKYIYTMGEEIGYVIKLINYPRFHKDEAEILHHVFTLANLLLDNTYQGSYTVLTPSQTYFVSKREGDKE